MAMLKSDTNGADAGSESTFKFVDQDGTRKPSEWVSPKREPYAIQRT
jgi:hypothetical protein